MSKATHGLHVTRNTKDMRIIFDLVNKATEKVEDTLTINWSDVHPDCRDFASLYGVSKILMDKQSAIDMMSKLEAFQELFDDTLKVGILNRERQSGGPTIRVEIEALANIKKITAKQAQKLLAKYDKEVREEILTSVKVKNEVAKMAKKFTEEAADEITFDDLITSTEEAKD